MSLKLKSLITVLAVALAVPAFAQKAEKAEKADKSTKASSGVSVNGVQIPKSFVDAMLREREASGQPVTPDMDKAIKDELATREVLVQAAKKKGLDKDATIAAQMDMARQVVLIRAFVDDYVKANPVGDVPLKAMYDQLTAQMGDKEYKIRHILVDSEDEAKTIIANLKRGDSFEKLAKEKSKDPGSKDNGGDLDWAPAGRYVPEFGNAVKALQKGQTTDIPVKTQFGYHVIRVDDSRALKVPSFEDSKESLRQRAQQDLVQRLIAGLRDKAKVEGL